jgi:hypothetical protein
VSFTDVKATQAGMRTNARKAEASMKSDIGGTPGLQDQLSITPGSAWGRLLGDAARGELSVVCCRGLVK